MRNKKTNLLTLIQNLDLKADSTGLEDDKWAYIYQLEEQILHLYRLEEEYWRQKGRILWVLQRDANTAYFHAIANRKCRKCNISSENGCIFGKRDLQEHIYGFYQELLGTSAPRHCCLDANTWGPCEQVSQIVNDGLALTFLGE